jgi:hypothetical protein
MSTWAIISYWYTLINLIIFVVFTIIMSVGGFIDLRLLFDDLNSKVVDERDDGRVQQLTGQNITDK